MTQEPLLLSKKLTAKLLGISTGMVGKLRRQGVLEGVQIGTRILFRRVDVEALTLTPKQKKAMNQDCAEAVQ